MKPKSTLSKDKYLSFILRHGAIEQGLAIDSQGYVDVQELFAVALKQNYSITIEELEQIVLNSDKKRYSFNEDKTRIRANQGHSITTVQLSFTKAIPPKILYHGTAVVNKESIEQQGLLRKERHHVHLSDKITTAIAVGRRHGKVLLYEIDTQAMIEDGYEFLVSDNNVWLVEHVPAKYMRVEFCQEICE